MPTALNIAAGETLSYFLLRFQLGKTVFAASLGSKTAAGIAIAGALAYTFLVLSYLVYEHLATFDY